MKQCRGSFLLVVFLILSATALGHDPIRIETKTSDGVEIVGDYWTPIRGASNAPAVIMLHMYRSDRNAWGRDMIIALEMAGFAIARVDLRGHGESLGTPEMKLAERVANRDATLFNSMTKDVEAVVKWLAARPEVDSSRLVLLGASVGCSVALDYAQGKNGVRGVALLSPGTQYLGIDSLEDVAHYGSRPLLMFTSKEEQGRGFNDLASAAEKAGARLQTRVFEESGIHGTRMLGKVEGAEELIATFLKESAN